MTDPLPARPQLAVRSADDLLAAVPYLLGFHPDDSIVVVAQHRSRVIFVERGDLPRAGAADADIRGQLACLAGLVPQATTAVALIGYGPADHVAAVIDVVRDKFTARGLPVRAALRLTDGRYYCLCGDPHCDRAEGTPFDPTTSTIAAEATFAGAVALPNRAELVARLAPVSGPPRQAMEQAHGRAHSRLARVAATGGPNTDGGDSSDTRAILRTRELDAIDPRIRLAGQDAVRHALATYDQGGHLTDDEAAWLTLLLSFTAVRDIAALDHPDHNAHLPLWTDLTRRAVPELVPAPATVLAFTAWQRGDGAIARIALDRALDADPTYSLAHQMADLLAHGLPPSGFDPDAAPGSGISPNGTDHRD